MERQISHSQPPVSLADPTTRVLLALTFVTGIVDAVSFLGLAAFIAGGSIAAVALSRRRRRGPGPKLGHLQ